MKKTFAFLSALLLLISLASCGAAPAQEEEKTDGSEKALPHKDINRIPFMSKARGHQKIW